MQLFIVAGLFSAFCAAQGGSKEQKTRVIARAYNDQCTRMTTLRNEKARVVDAIGEAETLREKLMADIRHEEELNGSLKQENTQLSERLLVLKAAEAAADLE